MSLAIAREKQIKGWLRKKKITLVDAMNPEWEDLSKGGTASERRKLMEFRSFGPIEDIGSQDDEATKNPSLPPLGVLIWVNS